MHPRRREWSAARARQRLLTHNKEMGLFRDPFCMLCQTQRVCKKKGSRQEGENRDSRGAPGSEAPVKKQPLTKSIIYLTQ